MKNKIIKILKEAGLYSAVYRDRVANEAIEILGDKAIDSAKFDSWLKGLNFEGQNIRTYFLGCLKNAVMQDLFNPSASSASPEAASAPQSVSEFEASWDEWTNLIFNLADDFPSRGVLSRDDNTHIVRGISDGKGGLIYIDGTVSEKYPRLEDLEPAEQQELIERVRVLHGSMANLDNILRSMQEHASAS